MTQRSLNSRLKSQFGIKLAGAYAGAKTFIQNSLVPQPEPDPDPEPEPEPEPNQVLYTANGAITNISPETVTWDDGGGLFVVPVSVEAFTFTDDGVNMTATYNGGTEAWDFATAT